MRFNGSVSGGVSGMMEILGEGDTISITPALTSGVEVATFKINEGTAEEETIKLYAPNSISWDNIANKPTLFSGSYADLSNKPTLNGDTINGNMFTHNYSLNEQRVGTWIDGKPLYQRTVDTGVLPNATLKTVAHNISNISKIVKYEGMALDSTGADVRAMPYVGLNNWSIGLYVDATNINIQTAQNWASDYPNSYVTIQYTKTTD